VLPTKTARTAGNGAGGKPPKVPPEPDLPPMPPPAGLPELGLRDALMAVEDEKSELDKIVELITNPKHIAHFTELSRNEIMAFSVLYTMAGRHKLPVLEEWLERNLILRVSRGRQGKKELLKMVSRTLAAEQAPDERTGFRRFMARRM